MKRILVITILLIGCAQPNNGGVGSSGQALLTSPTTNSKLLQSTWTKPDQSFTIDLSQIVVSTPSGYHQNPITIDYALSQLGRCTCAAEFDGDDSSGYFSITSCSYIPNSGGDPTCANIEILANFNGYQSNTYYSISDNALTLCFGARHSNCVNYL